MIISIDHADLKGIERALPEPDSQGAYVLISLVISHEFRH